LAQEGDEAALGVRAAAEPERELAQAGAPGLDPSWGQGEASKHARVEGARRRLGVGRGGAEAALDEDNDGEGDRQVCGPRVGAEALHQVLDMDWGVRQRGRLLQEQRLWKSISALLEKHGCTNKSGH